MLAALARTTVWGSLDVLQQSVLYCIDCALLHRALRFCCGVIWSVAARTWHAVYRCALRLRTTHRDYTI